MVTAAALALWVLGFKRFGLPLAEQSDPIPGACGVIDHALVLAISRTSRILPWSTCLTRACALTRGLRARGHNASLNIGIRRPDEGLQAHAWVELDGQAIGSDGQQASGLLRLLTHSGPRGDHA